MNKKGILFVAFFGLAFLFAQKASTLSEFKSNIKMNKNEAKKSIKPFLYDGYKTTYFNYKTYKQTKEVEIYLFNNTEYRLAFNGKSSPKPISVKIYNAPKSESDRILLREIKDVSGENEIISTKWLNDAYKKENSKATRLKRVFVNYEIPATPGANNSKPEISDRGAVVLVLGYKN
ncbi:MAG: hypothetical protein ACWA41_04005 [Putridiphycobacter sp.]